jgi:protein-S-isoprenylcysteine O-methyltransferase Ste14
VLTVIYSAALVVAAKPSAWLGILGITGAAVLPSLQLANWTTNDRRIVARSVLQSISWSCLLFWLFPSSIFLNTEQSWQPVLERSLGLNLLFLLPMLLPAGLIFSAVRQFAVEGDGTGFPYDPPKRLVTRGVYAYLSNPMQVGICLAMAWWGVVTESLAVGTSALVAVILFIVFKDVCNGSCAIGERDPNWEVYQREVPKWIPRRTAWTSPHSG